MLAWLYRFRRPTLVGPLFLCEVLRLARRGRGTLLRIGYALTLLLILGLVYSSQFTPGSFRELLLGTEVRASIAEQAAFAARFSLTLLVVQVLAILVLTPVFLGSTLGDERERGTLEVLFTTHLTRWELLVGKLLAQGAHLGLTLLAGFPVLAFVQVWGGVSLPVVIGSYAVAGLTLLSVGSLSLASSVHAKRALDGAITSGVAVIIYVFVGLGISGFVPACSPLVFQIRLIEESGSVDDVIWMVEQYVLVQGLISVGSLMVTGYLLRKEGGTLHRLAQGLKGPNIPFEGSIKLREIEQVPVILSPPIGNNAFFWKEVLHNSDTKNEVRLLPVLRAFQVLIAICVFLAVVALIQARLDWDRLKDIGAGFNNILRLIGTGWMGVAFVVIAFRAAISFSREYDRQTLDGLLVLPMARNDLLRAKWAGAILRARHVFYALAGLWLVGVSAGVLHPLGFALLLIITILHLVFIASLGVWVSLVCRTTLRAVLVMGCVLFALATGPWVTQLLLGWRLRPVGWAMTTPPGAWWVLAFSWREAEVFFRNPGRDERWLVPGIISAVGGALLSAILAGVFYRLARRSLQAEAE